MKDNFFSTIDRFWQLNVIDYIQYLQENPIRIILLIIDLGIVIFLAYYLIKAAKRLRVWQLIKGILMLVVLTIISEWIHLNILHAILSSVMTYGVIALLIIFQPELRRGLEQLGTNKVTKLFGIDKDVETRTREDIYKIAIAVEELAKTKTGALIVLERDIKLGDIVETGIEINSEISPQLLVNIFVPNTPLHDGAVIISNNKIISAACILPLSDDKQISKKYGTRHRAALGISKETDCIAIVVSEETGKISIAKDGTLTTDIDDEKLKSILIRNLVTKRFSNKKIKNRRVISFKLIPREERKKK